MTAHPPVQVRTFPGPRALTGIAAVVTLGAALAMPGTSYADAAATPSATTSMAPAVDGSSAGGPVIVVLKSQYSNLNLRTQASQRKSAAQSAQAPVVADIKSHGGADVTQLVAPDAVAAHLPAAEVSQLRGNPSVAEIVPDVPVPLAGQDHESAGRQPELPAPGRIARGDRRAGLHGGPQQ